MGDVTTLYQAPILRRDVADAAIALDVELSDSIDAALEAGVPIVMVIGMLQARLHFTTVMALTGEDDDDDADS